MAYKERTKEEIKVMIERLMIGKEKLPEYSYFGNANHEIIDRQIDVLEGLLDEDDVYALESEMGTDDMMQVMDAVRWMEFDQEELADDSWQVKKKVVKKPRKNGKLKSSTCQECPFRKKSLPGYLGEASHQPDLFLATIKHQPLPCHMEIDQENGEIPLDAGFGNPCLGALKYLKNTMEIPREAKYRELRNKIKDNDPEIFGSRNEFTKHHS